MRLAGKKKKGKHEKKQRNERKKGVGRRLKICKKSINYPKYRQKWVSKAVRHFQNHLVVGGSIFFLKGGFIFRRYFFFYFIKK